MRIDDERLRELLAELADGRCVMYLSTFNALAADLVEARAEVARVAEMVLALWTLAQISEGRAMHILAVDRLTVREMREQAFPDWDEKRAVEVLNGREATGGEG